MTAQVPFFRCFLSEKEPHLNAVESDLCCSVANFVSLASAFEDLFIRDTGRKKKAGWDDKREKKTTFNF